MKAIIQLVPGGPNTLELSDAEIPQVDDYEILINVKAAAFNPADVGTREGRYLKPGTTPSILGLECSGIVTHVGKKVSKWIVGDRVCALLSSGGYAEFVAVNEDMVMPIPQGLSFEEAASLPESLCTVWSNWLLVPEPFAPRHTLVHGGSGSVGSLAVQMAKIRGGKVFATAGTPEGIDLLKDLGVDVPINYRTDDFAEVVLNETCGEGVDQILDIMGASYFEQNIRALTSDGHLAMIGIQGGRELEVDLFPLLQKRITLTTTMLKNRREQGPHSKGMIVASVSKYFSSSLNSGLIRPVVGKVVPLQEARSVHESHANGLLPSGKTVFSV